MTPDLELEHNRREEHEANKSNLCSQQNKQLEDAKTADRLFQTILNIFGIAVRCYPNKNPMIHWGREELFLELDGPNLIAYWKPRINFNGREYDAGVVKSFFFANTRELNNWILRMRNFITAHQEEIEAGKLLKEIDSDNTRRGFRDP